MLCYVKGLEIYEKVMDQDQITIANLVELAYNKKNIDVHDDTPSVGSVNYTPYQIIMAFIVALVAFWVYILRVEGLFEHILKMSANDTSIVAAKETFQILLEISKILNTGLDETTLALCVRLCENGANPEAIAKVVLELQRIKREELNSHTRS